MKPDGIVQQCILVRPRRCRPRRERHLLPIRREFPHHVRLLKRENAVRTLRTRFSVWHGTRGKRRSVWTVLGEECLLQRLMKRATTEPCARRIDEGARDGHVSDAVPNKRRRQTWKQLRRES